MNRRADQRIGPCDDLVPVYMIAWLNQGLGGMTQVLKQRYNQALWNVCLPQGSCTGLILVRGKCHTAGKAVVLCPCLIHAELILLDGLCNAFGHVILNLIRRRPAPIG